MAIKEVLILLQENPKLLEDNYQASVLLESLKQVVNFKIMNKQIDQKTFFSILIMDLMHCGKDGKPKLFDSS